MRVCPRAVHAWLTVAVGLLCGCGGPATAFRQTNTTSADTAVELSLVGSEGSPFELQIYRGEPVLLFLFATWDTASQALLRPLKQLARRRTSMRILGIAIQPEAALFLDAWVQVADPPFPASYDPDSRIIHGITQLGSVAVPMLIVLDARGEEVARHTGFLGQRDLERWIAPHFEERRPTQSAVNTSD